MINLFRRQLPRNRVQKRRFASAGGLIESLESRTLLNSIPAPSYPVAAPSLSASLGTLPSVIRVGVQAEIIVTYKDTNGVNDIAEVLLQLNRTDDHPLTMMRSKNSQGTWIFSPWAAYGADQLDLTGTSVISQVGSTMTIDWKFTINNTWKTCSKGINYGVDVVDSENDALGWTYDKSSAAFIYPPPSIQSLTASPRTIQQGQIVRLTANGVLGDVTQVQFYRDVNSNGQLDSSDILLGSDNSISGEWTWVGSTASFPTGQVQYLARAQEAEHGTWSNVAVGGQTIVPAAVTPTKVVGYYPEYRYVDATTLNRIDLPDLTNLLYFRILVNADGSLNFIDPNDTTQAATDPKHLDLIAAAAHRNGCSISITVGLQSKWDDILKSNSVQTKFISNIVQFCSLHDLDGIDLDWEPLTEANPTASQVTAFGKIIVALHQYAPTLTLSAAVNANLQVPQPLYTIPKSAFSSLGWISVMGYDFTPGLNQSTYSGAITGLQGWKAYGVPINKLILGVPFYGRSGTTWANTTQITYGDLLSKYYNPPFTFPDSALDTINGWSFNGVATIRQKTQYVMANGYGGMMLFDVSQDYFDAQGQYDPNHSLLPQVIDVIHTFVQPFAPTIDVETPTMVSGFSGNQLLTITGSGFQPGCTVILTNTSTNTVHSSITIVSPPSTNQLTVLMYFGNPTKNQSWTIVIHNPDGGVSIPYSITVIPKAPLPFTVQGVSLGSFDGVTVYSNGATHDFQLVNGIPQPNMSAGINTGIEWQCVEYVYRYYWMKHQLNLRSLNGALKVGAQFYPYYSQTNPSKLTAYANNGTVPPQPGDIICFSGGPPDTGFPGGDGHVAIVREVFGNVISIAQQNVSGTYRDANFCLKYTILKKNGMTYYSVDASNLNGLTSTYICQGWLRIPGTTLPIANKIAVRVPLLPTAPPTNLKSTLNADDQLLSDDKSILS